LRLIEPWVRRAVPIATATCAHPQRLDWAAPLLELIEPLLSDRPPEVKGILGPRVLAHKLAVAGRCTRKALILLRKLALDERRYVRGAVAAALRRLGKIAPDPVLTELKRWLADEDRAPIARNALSSL